MSLLAFDLCAQILDKCALSRAIVSTYNHVCGIIGISYSRAKRSVKSFRIVISRYIIRMVAGGSYIDDCLVFPSLCLASIDPRDYTRAC